jgi:hypothetical protein
MKRKKIMPLSCSDSSRQKYGKWCALLDGIVASVWASAPDPGGVVAVGTAALDPEIPTAIISTRIQRFNEEMAMQNRWEELIDPAWAQRHPLEAFREIKRRKAL